MKRALQIILALSLFGLAFSGVLAFEEVFAASSGLVPCPAPGAPGTVLGYPACVYGFFMFLTIAITSALGLIAGRRQQQRLGVQRPEAPLPPHDAVAR